MFAFEKLPGLPRDRIVEAIAPVLRAHGLAGVELVWRTDGQGRVLQVTIESAEGSEPGGGVTLDVCSKVSRDLSTALDVLELIDGKYRLEVGSPGLERRLYTLADYRRFSGRLAKLKLASAVEGQYVLLGKLNGVDAEDRVLIIVDGVEGGVEHASKHGVQHASSHGVQHASSHGVEHASSHGVEHAVKLDEVRSGQLAIDWQQMGFAPTPRQRSSRGPAQGARVKGTR